MEKLTVPVLIFCLGLIAGASVTLLARDRIADRAIKAAKEEIAKLEVKETRITQTLQKEIIRERVYQECKHTDSAFSSVLELYK